MFDYYVKVQEGFEYCKKNLNHDLSLGQFESCVRLCESYMELCLHYINIVDKTNKNNSKYLADVCNLNALVLKNMLTTWKTQYDKMCEEDEIESKKQQDIITQLNISDEYMRQKNEEEKVRVVGFTQFSKQQKKSKKKKTK